MLPAANVKFTPFTEDMKKTHTILVPGMLPMHFSLLQAAQAAATKPRFCTTPAAR